MNIQDENLNLDKIERELKEISPWPWHATIEQEEEVDEIEPIWTVGPYNDRTNWKNDCNCNGYGMLKKDAIFSAQAPQRLAAAVKRIRELENIINEMDKLNKESKVIIENILKSSDEG